MKLQSFFPSFKDPALSFLKRPTEALGQYHQQAPAFFGLGARYAGAYKDTMQRSVTPAFAAIPAGATHELGVIQLLSDPLRKQEVPAGIWNLGFALQVANAGMTYAWTPKAALYVISGLTGERRATIFNWQNVGLSGRIETNERTAWSNSIAGASATLFGGDYLALELGVSITNTGAALAPQISLFSNGATPILADHLVMTDAQGMLVAPQPLLLSLPQPGEPPASSVSLEQALTLLKEHFPKGSSELYDWDSQDATIARYITFLGECIKIYGYDVLERLFREVSPLSCIELLPDWEGLLGITYTKVAQTELGLKARRDAVLAKLREYGGTTLFNVAAAMVPLAKFVPPDLPEILEISSDDLRLHNTFEETIPPPDGDVIPGTGFNPGNNPIRRTPVLLDGGHVWNSGVLLRVKLATKDTAALRFQITGPDLTVAQFEGGPSRLTDELWLRSPAHAGAAIHGVWQLNVYREGFFSPANMVLHWSLYVLGAGFGGRGQAKYNWSVYLDQNHQKGDRKAIDAFLSRVTQAYARSFVIYAKDAIPGSDHHIPGRFLPGT